MTRMQCPTCDTEMQALLTSVYCPNDCRQWDKPFSGYNVYLDKAALPDEGIVITFSTVKNTWEKVKVHHLDRLAKSQ